MIGSARAGQPTPFRPQQGGKALAPQPVDQLMLQAAAGAFARVLRGAAKGDEREEGGEQPAGGPRQSDEGQSREDFTSQAVFGAASAEEGEQRHQKEDADAFHQAGGDHQGEQAGDRGSPGAARTRRRNARSDFMPGPIPGRRNSRPPRSGRNRYRR